MTIYDKIVGADCIRPFINGSMQSTPTMIDTFRINMSWIDMFQIDMFRIDMSRSWLFATVLLLATICSACHHNASTKTDGHAADGSAILKELVVPVQLLQLNKKIDLPGQMLAYQDVPIHAKVEGFITWIGVDRGWVVKKGQKMITVYCPELESKRREAISKMGAAKSAYEQSLSNVQSEKSKLVEARAKLDADQLTYERLKIAARTPGAVAQNEVDIAGKTTEADRGRVQSILDEIEAAKNLVAVQKENIGAAGNLVDSFSDLRSYLTITAPFDGVITERNVHVGSIVAVDSLRGTSLPLVRIQEKSLLRLVVPVPEACVSGIRDGDWVDFTVPAFLGRTFKGQIARLGFALDDKTRSMPVEMNVYNNSGELEPGMFANVRWPVVRPYKTLFVPSSAVVSDLKETFVLTVHDDKLAKVQVKRGLDMGDVVEVTGNIKEGDLVILRGTDEYNDGTTVTTKMATNEDIKIACKSSSAGGD